MIAIKAWWKFDFVADGCEQFKMQVLADVFFIYIIFKKINCMVLNGMIF